MKRLCLFAGYNHNGVISDYVVYYIKEMSKLSDVYYMADCETKEEELAKLAPYVKVAYSYRHKKYDFGSWQELMWKLGKDKMAEYDELILCNDSCFGPLYPLDNIFERLDNDKEWDFCGMSKAYPFERREWNLVSYFLVFRKNVFTSQSFAEYMNNIEVQDITMEVIPKYEQPFTHYLINHGFKCKSIFPHQVALYSHYKKFIREGFPFIKIKLFTEKAFDRNTDNLYGWQNFVARYSNYDTDMIDKHLKKIDKFNSNIKYLFSFKAFRRFFQIFRRWMVQTRYRENSKIIRILGIEFINYDAETQTERFEDNSIPTIK